MAGSSVDKLDAPFKTQAGCHTVLQHVIHAAQASGLPWHVVKREDTAHLAVQGMGSSIAVGVGATREATGWLVLPGDLPLIRPASLRAVAQALQAHSTVVPMVRGQAGHPVGFDAACRADLLGLVGDQGARSILLQHPPHRLMLDDIGCTWDVDTPELLARAQAAANGQSAQRVQRSQIQPTVLSPNSVKASDPNRCTLAVPNASA